MYLTLRALPSCLEGFEVGAGYTCIPSLTNLKKIYELGCKCFRIANCLSGSRPSLFIRCILAVLLPAITINLRSRSNLLIIALRSIVDIFVIDDTYN